MPIKFTIYAVNKKNSLIKEQNENIFFYKKGEKSYEASHFHDRVMRFYIDDHNVPTLRETLRFAKDVKEWMEANQNNTIAIHCKGNENKNKKKVKNKVIPVIKVEKVVQVQ